MVKPRTKISKINKSAKTINNTNIIIISNLSKGVQDFTSVPLYK